jgi:hypothetical protein
VWKIKYFIEKRKKKISYIEEKEGRLSGLLTSCVGTASWNVIEGNIEGTGRRGRRRKQLLQGLKEKEDTGNWKREHKIAHCGELVLEETM